VTTEKHLSERDRAEVAAQIDRMIEVLADRYNCEPHEVVDAVRWVKEKREHDAKMRSAAVFSVIGVIVSAVLLALWEGFKQLSAGR
jgi:hypothetical protein